MKTKDLLFRQTQKEKERNLNSQEISKRQLSRINVPIYIEERSMNYWNDRFEEKKKKRRRRKRKGKRRRRKMWNKNVPSFVRFPWRCRRAIRFSASCSYSIFFCLCILEFFFSLASLYTHTDGKNAHATERKGAQFRLFSLKLSKHIPICLLAFFRLLFFFRPPLYLPTPPFPTSAVACTFFPCNDESRIVIKLRGLFNFSLETLLILSSKPSRTKNLFFRYFYGHIWNW